MNNINGNSVSLCTEEENEKYKIELYKFIKEKNNGD